MSQKILLPFIRFHEQLDHKDYIEQLEEIIAQLLYRIITEDAMMAQ